MESEKVSAIKADRNRLNGVRFCRDGNPSAIMAERQVQRHGHLPKRYSHFREKFPNLRSGHLLGIRLTPAGNLAAIGRHINAVTVGNRVGRDGTIHFAFVHKLAIGQPQ